MPDKTTTRIVPPRWRCPWSAEASPGEAERHWSPVEIDAWRRTGRPPEGWQPTWCQWEREGRPAGWEPAGYRPTPEPPRGPWAEAGPWLAVMAVMAVLAVVAGVWVLAGAGR